MQIRKYGISVFLISQRTAQFVAKSALSQCENLIAFRSVDQTGLDYLEAVAGGEIRYLLPQLRQGEALVFGPAISADGAVAVQIASSNAFCEPSAARRRQREGTGHGEGSVFGRRCRCCARLSNGRMLTGEFLRQCINIRCSLVDQLDERVLEYLKRVQQIVAANNSLMTARIPSHFKAMRRMPIGGSLFANSSIRP